MNGPWGSQQASYTTDSSGNVTGVIRPDGGVVPMSHVNIAVMSDSAGGQATHDTPAWPEILQNRLNALGYSVTVKNFGVYGHTFFRANTTASFGTQTQVQAVTSWKPDIVLVSLGGN